VREAGVVSTGTRATNSAWRPMRSLHREFVAIVVAVLYADAAQAVDDASPRRTVQMVSMTSRRDPAPQLQLPHIRRTPPPDPARPPLVVAGLFAGVGGLELGLRRSGHVARLLCEIEPGAHAVLRERFPDVALHRDVCTLAALPSDTQLVVGGFPCQDLSQAGKTVGIEGSRSGLVGEVFRLLRGQRIPWVLLENVPFMLQLSRGRAMDVIVETIESLGYRWAYRVVDSRAFGLPQQRERVLFLASLEGDPRDVLFADEVRAPATEIDAVGRRACGFYWTEGVRGLGWAVDAVPTLKGGSTVGIPSPPAIVLPNGEVVTPDIRDAERMQGFEPDWTTPSNAVARRTHRWKLVGNAVTVDVAAWLGWRLRNPSVAGRDVPRRPLVRAGAWPRAAWNVGDGRFEAEVSAFPALTERQALHEWLRFEPTPLSARAT
jgi:DNA (cytosine-5)-methyltransferase 1